MNDGPIFSNRAVGTTDGTLMALINPLVFSHVVGVGTIWQGNVAKFWRTALHICKYQDSSSP